MAKRAPKSERTRKTTPIHPAFLTCDKCDGPNDRANESNYCTPCSAAFQARTLLNPECQPVGTPAARAAVAPAPTAPSASTHEITSEMLASIRVLFRRDDSLCLYGIPYDMRPGQSPGDLWRASARHRERPPAVGFPAYVQPKPDPRLDPMHGWIWLGAPGWWGSMSPESRARVEAWLAARDGAIPEGPFEWCKLDPERCTICYQPAHATETDDHGRCGACGAVRACQGCGGTFVDDDGNALPVKRYILRDSSGAEVIVRYCDECADPTTAGGAQGAWEPGQTIHPISEEPHAG